MFYLFDLKRFVRFTFPRFTNSDRWFCAKRSLFSRLRREIEQIYVNHTNLFIMFYLFDLKRFVRFLREARSLSFYG